MLGVRMKKCLTITLILFAAFMMTGCDNKDISYSSKPMGYGLLDDTYVAVGSFMYFSEQPFNVNQVSLELYYLPTFWGEIEIQENNLPDEDNPDFLITNYDTPDQKVYAKYIYIGEKTWTAKIIDEQVTYVDQNDNGIKDFLLDEEEANKYVEAIRLNNAYFLNFEMVMLNGYISKLDTLEAGEIYQKIPSVQLIMINYAETLTSFPNLAIHYPEFDSVEVNTIFQLAYDKVEEPEYRIGVSYSK